jgi:hypothetical protein
MKNIAGALFLFLFSFTSFNFGQSILHPDKFGFAFQYGYSKILNSSSSINSITFLISPEGYFDFSLSISGDESFSSNKNQISGGITLYINNDIKNPAVSSFSAAYISAEQLSAFGLAYGINFITHRGKSFSVIPQFSAGFILIIHEAANRNFYYNQSLRLRNRETEVDYLLSLTIDFAAHIDDGLIISVIPGITQNSISSVFTITAGLTFTSL